MFACEGLCEKRRCFFVRRSMVDVHVEQKGRSRLTLLCPAAAHCRELLVFLLACGRGGAPAIFFCKIVGLRRRDAGSRQMGFGRLCDTCPTCPSGGTRGGLEKGGDAKGQRGWRVLSGGSGRFVLKGFWEMEDAS